MHHLKVLSPELADFMEELVDAGACGGARCHTCPFFIPGNASREGKTCASCPMRLFSLARQTANRIAQMGGYVYDRVTGHLVTGEPSDGHPQEELTPDFQLFRPFNANNPTWTLFWPELLI